MSSFFTVPGEKKRKRAAAPDGPKKRLAPASKTAKTLKTSRTGKTAATSKSASATKKTAPAAGKKGASRKEAPGKTTATRTRTREDDDESISGSDSDSDGLDGRRHDAEDGEAAGHGSGDDDNDDDDSDLESLGDGDEAETAAERRLRLAERYLENVRQDVAAAAEDTYAFDAEEIDRDLIAERLEEDVAEAKGRVYRRLADELGFAEASHCLFRWNAQNVNAVAVCPPFAYTGSSDTYLTKWRIQDLPAEQQRQRQEREAQRALEKRGKKKKGKKGKKAKEKTPEVEVPARRRPERVLYRRGDPRRRRDKDYMGHVGAILAVAASADGRFVVTGGADRRLVVYDAATLKPLRMFTHHRDAVTGLVFRRGTNQLYSCSRDRTIKIWSLDELAYVQTLFGHQDDVADIDALAQERCLSVGTRDRTARMWKVVEETQLVFRGGGAGERASASTVAPGSAAHEGSMDRVAMLDDELFVTGSDNGALALWSTQKKKPLFVVPRAHGLEPVLTGRETFDRALADPAVAVARPPPPPQPRWITALRTVPYADVVLSGSWDGCVRVWRLSADKRKLETVGILGHATGSRQKHGLAIPGVVNGIAAFERGERGRDGLCIVAVVGREHRLGRWARPEDGRNAAVVFEVPPLATLEAEAKAKAEAETKAKAEVKEVKEVKAKETEPKDTEIEVKVNGINGDSD